MQSKVINQELERLYENGSRVRNTLKKELGVYTNYTITLKRYTIAVSIYKNTAKISFKTPAAYREIELFDGELKKTILKSTKQIVIFALKLAQEYLKDMNTLPKTFLYEVGYFDKANRYYLYDFFETASSSKIREPSRNWPFSKWQHVKTAKYFNSLSSEQLARLGLE